MTKLNERDRFWLRWALLVLVFLFLGLSALYDAGAQSSGPITTPAINKTFYYVGTSPYLTIQTAVTAACAAAVPKGVVIVPPNATPADTPTAATGCTGVGIQVQAAGGALTCYVWGASGPYAAAGCVGGAGGFTGSVNLTNQVGVYANGALQSFGNPFSMAMTCVAGGVTIGSGNFEIGYATTNPNVCTITYSNGTAASAAVTDGTNSYTDTTPYTVFTGAHSYTANTTFTGSATATNSQTANVSKTFTVSPCTFTGLTTNGTPTGATASGSGAGNQCASETATLTGGGTLTSHGLGATTVGTVFSFSSPGGDYVNLFLTETSSGCNRNPFTFNGSSPVNGTTQPVSGYTNILGGSQPFMCIYTFGPYSTAVTLEVAH